MLSQFKTWQKEVRKLVDKKVVVDGEKVALNNDHYRELANLNLVPYESCFLKKTDTEGVDIVDENKPNSKCDLYKQINSYRTAKAKKKESFNIDLFVHNTQPRQSKDELISQLRLELQREKDSNKEKDEIILQLRSELKKSQSGSKNRKIIEDEEDDESESDEE